MKFEKNNLVQWVLGSCVAIPADKLANLQKMTDWCTSEIGKERPGSILFEAMEGYIDYHDGSWSYFISDLDDITMFFWFGRKTDRVNFTLTWL